MKLTITRAKTVLAGLVVITGLVSLTSIDVVDPVVAQDQSTENPPNPCAAQEYRQFDFWVGEWEVEAGGKRAGRNRIRVILDGCALLEEWESANGKFKGKSFNRYERRDGKWHQLWIDTQGTALDLVGEYRDGKMVMSGTSTGQDGKPIQNRITWHNNADGTVRQVWEQSSDGGETWKAVFDGLYRRVES